MKFQILFISFLAILGIFLVQVYPFLSKSEPIESEVMVVEGWVDRHTLKVAAEQFKNQHNNFLVTAGGPLPNDLLMSFNSELKFNALPKGKSDHSTITIVEVKAFGEKAEGVYARFKLSVNDSIVGEAYTFSQPGIFRFKVGKPAKTIQTIGVIFDNDASNENEDRNLILQHIVVNGVKLDPFSNGVSLNFKNSKKTISEPVFKNLAERSAYFLAKTGISKNKIIPVPNAFVERDRTYESALAVKHLLTKQFPAVKKINIVSRGPHARRSWMMYKKAFGKDYTIGVIAIDGSQVNASNWWHTKKGVQSVMVQFGKYLYAQFIFDPFY